MVVYGTSLARALGFLSHVLAEEGEMQGLLRSVVMSGFALVAASGCMAVPDAADGSDPAAAADQLPKPVRPLENSLGVLQTAFTGGGVLNVNGPFFMPQKGSKNDRACVTCHVPELGWTITAKHAQDLFKEKPKHPLFSSNDGADMPDAAVGDASRHKYILERGLIRVGLKLSDIKTPVEFDITADPAEAFKDGNEVSVYRRPLPSTNLDFLTTIMWDGRETQPDEPGTTDERRRQILLAGLRKQANDATMGHAEANHLEDAVLDQIVNFETSLRTAQVESKVAGRLDEAGAKGGIGELSKATFYQGINDPLGGDRPGTTFDKEAFKLFGNWLNFQPKTYDDKAKAQAEARRAIARGEKLFNTRTFSITDVRGLNLGQKPIEGTCTTCHDTPSVGNHSVPLPLDIGLTDESRRGTAPLIKPPVQLTPLPLFTLTRKGTGEVIKTTDPGRALITGKWNDVARFKGAIVRGLAARPPYFHNGFAATLEDVVEFYNTRFNIKLSDDDKKDLAAFLKAL
jgi:hypothetical protein